MSKRPAIGLADLLDFALGPHGLSDATAELLGYERTAARVPEQAHTQPPIAAGIRLGDSPESTVSAREVVFPAERPRLSLWQAVTAKTFAVEPVSAEKVIRLSEAELSVPTDKPGLKLLPLMPWSRLAPVVKRPLGISVSGYRVDLPRCLRMVSAGQPFTVLPRLRRTVWAAEAVLLWDRTAEMWPFTEDVRWLLEQLQRERGGNGLRIIRVRSSVPDIRDFHALAPATPILAVSAMGQFLKDSALQATWADLGRQLVAQGHPLFALSPCPRHRWQRALVRIWPTVVWDRHPRPPRRGGMTAGPRRKPQSTLVERLLVHLAPAPRIDSPLLRAARVAIGPPHDAGTEWEAWFHTTGWFTNDCFGSSPGPAQDQRLVARQRLVRRQRALAQRIATAMRTQFTLSSAVNALETELRLAWSGTLDEDHLAKAKALFQRVVAHLREIAREPGGREGRECGLPVWWTTMDQWMIAKIRSEPTLQDGMARGLALAHTWLQADQVPLSAGIDRDVYAEELRAAGRRVRNAAAPEAYLLGVTVDPQAGPHVSFFPAKDAQRPPSPLGRVLVGGSRRVQITEFDTAVRSVSLQLDGGFHRGVAVENPVALRIETSHAQLDLAPFRRPAWAKRFWHDRYGLAAEFVIEDVPFVLRWIPPGQFLMGSPESELGRHLNEGPQHLVTITKGFWLGETIISLAQHAVVHKQATAGNNRLMRPLDTIDAVSAQHYVSSLNRRVTGLQLTLPTEAQWEYACRAGTTTAYNNGTECTVLEGNDPSLDMLGWYRCNIDKDAHIYGTRYDVKQKAPNAWGLYDMHGTAEELCIDGLRDYTTLPQVDPVGDKMQNILHAIRGGSIRAEASGCRSATRWYDLPSENNSRVGFRICFNPASPGRE